MYASTDDHDGFLYRLNPLSKLLATIPLLCLVALTSDGYTPLAFLLLTLGLLLLGARLSRRSFLHLLLPLLGLGVGFLLFYPLIVRRELVQDSPILWTVGPFTLYQRAVTLGLAAGLRVMALIALTLPFSLTTDPSALMRALVQQWRLPYKLGYSALAAFRFLPMLQHELRVIHAAHRIRGVTADGSLRARFQQVQRAAIPLLATAIRRAERTALAMDGRAFGAFPKRTYYRQMRFTWQDILFIGACWLVSGLLTFCLWLAGLLGPLVWLQRL